MSDTSKKYILNLLESVIPKQLTTVLEDMLFSIEVDINNELDYEFALIDNINTECPPDTKKIYFGKLKDRKSFFEKGGIAILSMDIVNSETELTYFKRLLGDNSTLDVVDSFQTKLRALGSIKVTDHLNSGFYCDSIAVKAAEEGFKFLNIKKGIFNLFSLISDIVFEDKGEFPVDVDFGVSGESFFIQSHFPVEEFYSELIWELLSDEKSPLSLMIDSSKTIDIYTLKKTEKLVVTISWGKQESLNKSLYIHSIDAFRAANRKTKIDQVRPLKLNYNKDLELDLPKKKKSSLSLSKISRVVTFLKQQEVDIGKITISNVTDYLGNYPNQALVANLGALEKEEILNIIQDQEIQNEVSSSIEKEKKKLSDDLLESFMNKVEGLNLNNINEIISLGLQDYTESTQRVSGWMDEVDDSVQIVKGSLEDIGEDSILVKGSQEDIGEDSTLVNGSKEILDEDSLTVRGEREDIGEDKDKLELKSLGDNQPASELPRWRTSKDLLVSQIKKKIANKEFKNPEDLESGFSKILQDEMNLSEQESMALSSGVLNESAIESFQKRAEREEEKNDGESLRLKDAVAKKDIQISRMMKLIDAMKKELLVKSPKAEDVDKLKNDVEIKRLQTEIENKNSQIEILNKNVEILNSKQMNDKSITVEPIEAIETKEYEARIKSLESTLSDTKERNEILNEKLEKEREEFTIRVSEETIQFREKMMKSQKVINTYQKENKELLLEIEKLKVAQEELSNIEPEPLKAVDTNLIDEKVQEIETLNLELKKAADQSKGFGLRIKQLEQKNKFLLAQVEQGNRVKNKNKSTGNSNGDNKLQHKVKHLEKLSNNFKSEAESVKLELAEKKKEIHKLKLDSSLLRTKVTDLERKLAVNKKRAA